MSQSLSKVIIHIVFSTKDRMNMISSSNLNNLHAYLAKVCQNHGSKVFQVGGVEDHVHLACTLPRTMSISKLMEEVKKSSSKWLKEYNDAFQWQNGYGVFSLSPSHLDRLIDYIKDQHEHHKGISFKDELRLLCDKYGISYDEAYLWD